ncbi:hypothetical protein B0H11DRAFT_1956134 [Mycena galericulata]|nr:hypothetical protein B0H11DRAFT_1956134 [Mycena galericulata]
MPPVTHPGFSGDSPYQYHSVSQLIGPRSPNTHGYAASRVLSLGRGRPETSLKRRYPSDTIPAALVHLCEPFIWHERTVDISSLASRATLPPSLATSRLARASFTRSSRISAHISASSIFARSTPNAEFPCLPGMVMCSIPRVSGSKARKRAECPHFAEAARSRHPTPLLLRLVPASEVLSPGENVESWAHDTKPTGSALPHNLLLV